MNLLYTTMPLPRILRWLLDFWKSCATLNYENFGFLVALSVKLTCMCDVMPCNLVDSFQRLGDTLWLLL